MDLEFTIFTRFTIHVSLSVCKGIIKPIFTKLLLTLSNCAWSVILIHFLDSVMVERGVLCKFIAFSVPLNWLLIAVFSGHPWILFYTERTLKTLSIRSKTKNQGAATSCQPANALVSPGNQVGAGSSEEDLSQHPSDSLSCKSEEQDECGLVDALAVAISHVKISEPKRSRLCGPTGPIEQQCSSNITANNLCRAFWFWWHTDTTNIAHIHCFVSWERRGFRTATPLNSNIQWILGEDGNRVT
jgi:hypothetical protein